MFVDKVIRNYEEQAVNDRLFKKRRTWRNAEVNTRNKDHEQKRLKQQVYPHLYLWNRILRKGICRLSGRKTVASLRSLVSVGARRSIVPEALTTVPVEIHDCRCHDRKEDGVNHENRGFGSARGDARKNAGHERNKEDGGKNAADKVHLLFDARSFIGTR